MSRLEYKYYFPLEYLDELRKDVNVFLNRDTFTDLSPKKEYTVRSIYLDSPQFSTFYEKLAGLKSRLKFRIRSYNHLTEDSLVFLEIKRKENDFVSKDRAPLAYTNLEELIRTKDLSLLVNGGNNTTKKQEGARNFFYYFELYNLKPAVLIVYEREAFECKFGSGLRITFDKKLRARLVNSYLDFSDEKMIPTIRDVFVLEVKFNRIIPPWLTKILSKFDTSREAISKYVIGLEKSIRNHCLFYYN